MPTKKKLLIACLLLIFAYVAFVLLDNYKNSQAAKENIVIARSDAISFVDEKVGEAIVALNKLGAITSNLGSSKVDVCYTDYRGKTANSWYQDCYLRYIEGFSTNLNIDEVRNSLLSDPKSISIFGNDSSLRQTDPDHLYCTLFDRFNHDNEYRTELVMIPVNTKGSYGECEVPNLLQSYGSVKGHIKSNNALSVKTYKTFDTSVIDGVQNQIWLVLNKHYYHEELGCAGIIGCFNPRGKPAHPPI